MDHRTAAFVVGVTLLSAGACAGLLLVGKQVAGKRYGPWLACFTLLVTLYFSIAWAGAR